MSHPTKAAPPQRRPGPEEDQTPLSSHRGERGFRRDVEGIRAVAVLMVLLFHAQVPGMSGGFVGVDVFFVVSGFLITGLLVRELARSGRVDFARFYARRAKRLLPAGTLVLVVTVLATWLLLPASRWPSISDDVRGAALFVANWVFAGRSTDYLAAEEAASPVQHFWSLSVEEQFYFVWPALLTAFAIVAGRRRARLRRSLLVAMSLVLIPSLAHSLWLTVAAPASAYFSTFTRLWEMALGGVIALIAPECRRFPARVRAGLGWIGGLAVVGSLVLIDETMPFPGVVALAPTLGAAALIVAGMAGPVGWVSRALSVRPMVWVGGLSYSLYLWHWPAVAIVLQLRPGAGWTVLVPITVASAGVAWTSLQLVENPVRHASVLRDRSAPALVMGACLVATSVLAGQALHRAGGVGQSSGLEDLPPASAGAARLLDRAWVAANPDPEDSFDPLVPRPIDAVSDNPVAYSDGCQLGRNPTELMDCQYGVPGATFEIALAGDSHATSWLPTLMQLASSNGWGLRALLKTQCPLTDSAVSIDDDLSTYDQCERWKSAVRDRLAVDPPDLLLLTSVNYVRVLDPGGAVVRGSEREEEIRRGFRVVAEEAESRGTTPVFIADVPLMRRDGVNVNIPDCASAHRDELSMCAIPRSSAIDAMNPVDRMLGRDPAYDWRRVDLTDGICLPEWCPAAVGNVLVYRDYGHLTRTYAETLTPWMEAALQPWLPTAR